jgi:hypothetical protein
VAPFRERDAEIKAKEVIAAVEAGAASFVRGGRPANLDIQVFQGMLKDLGELFEGLVKDPLEFNPGHSRHRIPLDFSRDGEEGKEEGGRR